MSKLVNAMRQKDSYTANGAVTHSTSLDAVVDMFYLAGASRSMPEQSIINVFTKAFAQNPELALKCLYWSRDVRGGAGERRFFQTIMKHLLTTDRDLYDYLAGFIPEYGYWKELFLFETPNEHTLNWMRNVLQDPKDNQGGLLAKWFPRKGAWFVSMHKFANLTPKQFRKLLVEKTKVVETQMCNREWSGIEYSKIPSQAFQRYKNAFKKRDEIRFTQFLQAAVKGEVKINSATLFPYQLYQSYNRGENATAINAQWQNLPDYVREGSFIPVCDVSGSMTGMPMDISVSLGVYLSERNRSIFKDAFITFSSTPKLQYLKGTVVDRFRQLRRAEWGMSTNLQAVFELILSKAVENQLSSEDLPGTILIISDMEFNFATENNKKSNFEAIQKKFAKAGYTMPKLVFWNVNGREGNVPVSADTADVALVSGASPAIVENVLAGKDFTPRGIMLETLGKDRYQKISYETYRSL
jgi:hypothetical protein